MARNLDKTLLEVIRQEFLGGGSLRDLAKKHGCGLRTLARVSKGGDWQQEREKATLGNAVAKHVPALVAAADRRAASIEIGWRNRLEGLLDTLAAIVTREADLLALADTSEVLIGDRAALLRIISGCLKDLRSLMPEQQETGVVIDPATVRAAQERLAKRFELEHERLCAECQRGRK